MTIQQALDVSQRTVSYRDAEVLLAATLQVDRSFLYAHPDQVLTEKQQGEYAAFLDRREKNEPVAYITGYKEFYGRRFKTDQRALIPRPETEAIIEQALAAGPVEWALELGTGSGNIAITLALEGVAKNILATDISSDALGLAQENWQRLGGDKKPAPTFLQASLFDHPVIAKHAPYDLLLANLPYVSTDWQQHPAAQPDVLFYEPDVALFGGQDGLDLYRQFFHAAPQYLHKNGRIIIEYGEDQTKGLLPLAKAAFPSKACTVHQDYA